jgi:hypothetical protein
LNYVLSLYPGTGGRSSKKDSIPYNETDIFALVEQWLSLCSNLLQATRYLGRLSLPNKNATGISTSRLLISYSLLF